VEKKTLATATFISALLFSAASVTQLIDLGSANPFLYEPVSPVSPQFNVKPPTISILSPKNNEIFISNNVTLTFNVSLVVPDLPELFYYYVGLSEVYYKLSWLSNNTFVDLGTLPYNFHNPNSSRTLDENSHIYIISGYELSPNFSINLKDVPDGNNSIEVFAVLQGSREADYHERAMTIYYGSYELIGSATVNFTIDSTAFLSPQNKTYSTADVPLLLRSPGSFKQIEYSLDGQDNVKFAGNTTLTGLSNGEHNITVYTTDETGNTGVSETITFNVDAPFPITLVAAASVATVAVVGVGLLVYFKKRKH
jgi:hypothetical protein